MKYPLIFTTSTIGFVGVLFKNTTNGQIQTKAFP